MRGHIYRWDVYTGTFSYEIDRENYGPQTLPMQLGPRTMKRIPVLRAPESAPGP